MTTRVALVGGTGKLGTIIAEVIEATEGFETVAVLGSASDLGEIDGAVVVTPTVTHFDVASELIRAGVHVFVEKPITPDKMRDLLASIP